MAAMLLSVDARLTVGGQEVQGVGTYFSLTKRRRGQFNFLIWTRLGTLAPYARQSAKHG